MKFFAINRIALAAVAISLATFLFSCQKESSNQNKTEVTEEEALVYSEESTEVEASYDDVEDISFTAATEEGLASGAARGTESARFFPFLNLRARIGQCAEITVTPDDTTYPKTVTIDFGDGCRGLDGKLRKGVIVLHFTGPIREPGSVLTITLEDFYLNRAHIEGTKVITNLSDTSNIKYTVAVVDGKATFPNGKWYEYNAMREVTQIEGGTTDQLRDDVYSIEGRSETAFSRGASHNSATITLNTETPLIKKVACHWISEGILKIKINNRVLLLDYAAPNNGDCDNKAKITWNNGTKSRIIALP
jgi:hypothetical protein